MPSRKSSSFISGALDTVKINGEIRSMKNASDGKAARSLVAKEGSTSFGATLQRRGFDPPAFRRFAHLKDGRLAAHSQG